MKKLSYVLITLLLSYYQNCFSQDYVIEYSHKINFETNLTEATYNLETNKQESVYHLIKNKYNQLNSNEVINANEGVVPFLYKNFRTKKIIYNQPIINKILFINEDIPLQTWKLENEIKNIKSLTCKKATSTFRGRTYVAWYTEDINILGGPWKFDGLPGLILAIASDDGVFNIEAIKIEKKDNLKLTNFQYEVDKLITWKEYCSKYNQVIDRIKKNMKADSDPDAEYDIKIDLVEYIGL